MERLYSRDWDVAGPISVESIQVSVLSKVPACCLKESTPRSVVLSREWLRQGSPNLLFLRDGSKQQFVNDFIIVFEIIVYLVYFFKHRPAQNGTFSLALCSGRGN